MSVTITATTMTMATTTTMTTNYDGGLRTTYYHWNDNFVVKTALCWQYYDIMMNPITTTNYDYKL